MANKYLDLAGLQSYNELLLTSKLNDGVTYSNTATGSGADTTNGLYRVFFEKNASNKITKSTAKVVDLATLKTDLGISDAVNDVSAGSGTGELSVTKNGTASTVTIPGMATQSGEAGSKTSTATEDQIVLGSDTRLNGAIQSVKVNGSVLTPDANKAVDITSIPAAIVAAGALADGMTATTQSANDNSTKIATTAYVDAAVSELPQAMIFRGTLGESATISLLPTASASTVGDVYKVITKGTYGGQSAEIGDLFVCAQEGTSPNFTYAWVLIPSGDVPSGTVTSVAATGDAYITVSGSPITDSGTLAFTHATQTGLPETAQGDATAQTPAFGGTFKALSATVNAAGHVTALSEHTVTIPATKATNVATGAETTTATLGLVKGNVDGGIEADANGALSITSIPTSVMTNVTDTEINALFA